MNNAKLTKTLRDCIKKCNSVHFKNCYGVKFGKINGEIRYGVPDLDPCPGSCSNTQSSYVLKNNSQNKN